MNIGFNNQNSYSGYSNKNNKVTFQCNKRIVEKIVDTYVREGEINTEEFDELRAQIEEPDKPFLKTLTTNIKNVVLKNDIEKFFGIADK